MELKFYQLKVSLAYIQPEIYRRIVVPANISLDRLHDVFQIAMGWKNYHLHLFLMAGMKLTEDPETEADGVEEGLVRLNMLMQKKGNEFKYVYDFGDDWMHEIVVEDDDYKLEEGDAPIMIIEGERACPPEDVGGPPMYDNFCEAYRDTGHEQHEEYVEWFESMPWFDGRDFDPEYFPINKVNFELAQYLGWARERYLGWEEDEEE